ncbi:beta-lactamase domain protein [Colletotrichum tofieldiae]|uniref:Beta-lactamase domain protein n=1 Tax=Colletotrichum tofieldiae TaxID=708197 RepID=A0A166MIP2_9PEZI|nr:beta-lactamase domain protein [Colletotrichum tofieldiae]GKT66372.1 beta-lactamase domain protein [Colletotrichum tofieldiae]GKT82072.1 beta-lactamase domain protein [Colletotrichum tofieldiae]GKT95407.1 beta-lactamase domain protein [Colletotrichum tofieldiae]
MRGDTIILCSFFAIWTAFAHAQFQDFFNITTFPNEQKDNVTRWLAEAHTLASTDLYAYFAHRCILGQVYPELSSASQNPGFIAPREVFDRFYFIGQSAVSAWAYDTSEGLVVFDALNNAEEAENILIPNLEALGFTGNSIKHLIITHEHFDHYGGVRWIQDKFQPATYATAAAWDTLATIENGPLRDKTIAEGDVLTFSNVTFKFHVTPGHTPGTLSSIFPIYDKGVEHTAGFYGGVGIPSSAAAKDQQIVSLNRFAGLGEKAGVDTLIANHQTQDRALYHFDLLEHRATGSENPFVIGEDAFNRYLRVNAQCVRVKAARDGQNLQV